MILTVTMNPSVDIAYQVDDFQLDAANRAAETHKTPGGKGLNVTRVLSQFGDEVVATGLIGGKIGEFLTNGLDETNIRHSFYEIAGETRNCIAILHDGKQTEVLESGPTVSEEESEGFLKHFSELLDKADVVAISGSLPKGVATDYYSRMIAICNERQVPVVLDSSGQALVTVLENKAKPMVIKPNTDELSQILGATVEKDVDQLKEVLQEDIFKGIEWVIVSLGSGGAFAKHNNQFYKVNIEKISVVNPTGSGDSTVSGITSALVHGLSDKDLLKRANVLGMLNAQEKKTGYVNMSHYEDMLKKINVVEV